MYLVGNYAVAQGPAVSASYRTGSFQLAQPRSVEFCFYRAIATGSLRVIADSSSGRQDVFESPKIRTSPHNWVCVQKRLSQGTYQGVSKKFTVDSPLRFRLRPRWATAPDPFVAPPQTPLGLRLKPRSVWGPGAEPQRGLTRSCGSVSVGP